MIKIGTFSTFLATSGTSSNASRCDDFKNFNLSFFQF